MMRWNRIMGHNRIICLGWHDRWAKITVSRGSKTDGVVAALTSFAAPDCDIFPELSFLSAVSRVSRGLVAGYVKRQYW